MTFPDLTENYVKVPRKFLLDFAFAQLETSVHSAALPNDLNLFFLIGLYKAISFW